MGACLFALQHTVDAVIITNLESVIQYVNAAFTEITGFSAEEAVGRKPGILRSTHTTAETYRRMWESIRATGSWHGDLINVRKSGEEWHSHLSISQVKDTEGRPFAYVGIAHDITEMKQLEFRLKEASLEAIFMLSVACEAKDEDTGNHVRRVQHYSHAVALKLGLAPGDAEEIAYSSIMHDLGKLHIPDAILQKPGPLTAPEWTMMKRHPRDGVTILRDKPFYSVARSIADNHHEKWDGSGYPGGKRGEEIPLAARIVAVADVYDALATKRPYKPPWPDEQALDEIRRQRGRAFDPRVVDAFLTLHDEGVVARIRQEFS
jgi:PAS domain S-box-containing protein